MIYRKIEYKYSNIKINIITIVNKLAKLGDVIAISNLKLSITDD